MTPEDYNASQLASGALTWAHITKLVRAWQQLQGLTVDGKAGPQTIATLTPPPSTGEIRISADWLTGSGVTRIDAHSSWYGPLFTTVSRRSHRTTAWPAGT